MATFVLRDDAFASVPRDAARWSGGNDGGWLPAEIDAGDVHPAPAESRLACVLLAGPAILVTCAALAVAVLTRPIAALRVAWGATHDSAPQPPRLARCPGGARPPRSRPVGSRPPGPTSSSCAGTCRRRPSRPRP
jgi:hypothetical protein